MCETHTDGQQSCRKIVCGDLLEGEKRSAYLRRLHSALLSLGAGVGAEVVNGHIRRLTTSKLVYATEETLLVNCIWAVKVKSCNGRAHVR